MSRFRQINRSSFIAFLVLAVLAAAIVTYAGRDSPSGDAAVLPDYPYRELAVEYARAALRLAEAELSEAVQQNAQRPRSVSQYDLERRRLHVQLAEQNLSDAQQGADCGQQIVGYMELQLHLAELDLKSEERLRNKHPELVSDTKLERLRSYTELCRLRLKLHGTQISPLQLVDHLHWETHRLAEEMLLLNRRVENLEEVALR